jgi:hypothetical protein
MERADGVSLDISPNSPTHNFDVHSYSTQQTSTTSAIFESHDIENYYKDERPMRDYGNLEEIDDPSGKEFSFGYR